MSIQLNHNYKYPTLRICKNLMCIQMCVCVKFFQTVLTPYVQVVEIFHLLFFFRINQCFCFPEQSEVLTLLFIFVVRGVRVHYSVIPQCICKWLFNFIFVEFYPLNQLTPHGLKSLISNHIGQSCWHGNPTLKLNPSILLHGKS